MIASGVTLTCLSDVSKRLTRTLAAQLRIVQVEVVEVSQVKCLLDFLYSI